MTCRVPENFSKIQNMHNYAEICKICIFLKMHLKITFLGISDDSEHS